MPLVDWQIRQEIAAYNIIEPFDEALLNPASLDVRVGETAFIESITGAGFYKEDLRNYTYDYPYWIEPKEFILVSTAETFNLPAHLSGEFRIKSSRAREGYNNLLAVWLDPLWTGSKLTLEIVNENRFAPIPLYPGLKIGQIIFHRNEIPEVGYDKTGRYNYDQEVAGSKG